MLTSTLYLFFLLQKRIEEIESTPSISVLDTSSQIESVKNVADAFNDEGKNSENSPENSWKVRDKI